MLHPDAEATPKAAKPGTYIAEEADLEATRDRVFPLWIANLSGMSLEQAEAKLRAGYLNNPAGRGSGVLLRREGEDAVIGVIGLHPRTLHLGPRCIRAAGLGDFAVDAAHRTLGPAITLMKRALAIASQRYELVYGLPNNISDAVCTRAGLRRMGGFHRHAKALSVRHYLAPRLPALATALLAPPIDAAMSLSDRLRSLLLRPCLTMHPASFDEPAIEVIWDRRETALLVSDRSKAMLRWRYGIAERGVWHLCVARDDAAQPIGYVAWRPRDGSAEVGDFFCTRPERLTAALMQAFSRHARGQGLHSVSLRYFGNARVASQLVRAGYRVRDKDRLVFIAATNAVEVGSEERWYLTAFDNDAN